MFEKITSVRLDKDSVEILDGELIKTAALKLPDGIEYDPDFFYCKVRAVSAGEYWGCNKNFDYFPEEELKNSYKTFLNAHVFKNHENKDVANAIGDVLDSVWDDKMKCVILTIRIDRRIAPTIVRGFEKGFMTDVSMGCRISHSVCSYCGQKAKTKFDYCDHIKFMRGKIFDNGIKVYEVNIAPKFHDISAVLNGAEKSAKIQDMMTDEKVASEEPTMEKAASLEESFTVKLEGHMLPNIDSFNGDCEIFEKKASTKKDYLQKVAEIKKEIQGKIVGLAKGELLTDSTEKIDSVAKIVKLLYTDYFDKAKCNEIADTLKELAIKKQAPKEVVFHQFLKVLDFAGIDLTPLELNDIFYALIGKNVPDMRGMNFAAPSNADTFMDNVDELTDCHSVGNVNIPTMFNTIEHKLNPFMDSMKGFPADKLKAVIIKLKMPTPEINEDLMYNDIMDNVVKDLMPSRSSHRNFILKRFEGIGNREPNFANAVHYAPTAMLRSQSPSPALIPFLLSALMHANYERERVAHYLSDDMDYGLSKFAGYIEGETMDNLLSEYAVEKTAGKKRGYGLGKALLLGVPLTYAYSAIQRARMHNGDNVNTANRYIAENPGNAALLQVVAGPKVAKAVGNKITGANEALVRKYASEDNLFEEIYKQASVNDDDNLYNKDMFKDFEIDNALKEVYNDNQVGALKQACILNFMERQDLATDVLAKNALEESDLSKYLKIAKDSIKIEIEKNASQLPALVKNTAAQGVLHPGKITAATLPGFAVDAAALLWLDKKIQGKSPKK